MSSLSDLKNELEIFIDLGRYDLARKVNDKLYQSFTRLYNTLLRRKRMHGEGRLELERKELLELGMKIERAKSDLDILEVNSEFIAYYINNKNEREEI